MVKDLEKIDAFWDFVFGGILEGFWEGFWEAQNFNFHTFFRCFFEVIFEDAKNTPKTRLRPKNVLKQA